jgi:hypothetical protein
LPGSAGCPRHFFFSLPAACGGEEKGEKEFFGVTPKPGRDAPLPALSFFEWLFQKCGMTHDSYKIPLNSTLDKTSTHQYSLKQYNVIGTVTVYEPVHQV